MNERITIKNFAGFQKVTLDLARINLLIGPQASGKSVCVKLLYYFKGLVPGILNSIWNKQNRQEFEVLYKNKFEEYFPPRYWGQEAFSIRYENDPLFIEIRKRKGENAKIRLEFSDSLKEIFDSTNNQLLSEQALPGGKQGFDFSLNVASEYSERIIKEFNSSILINQFFIPAGRSFFATLQSSIFSVLSNNKIIDPFLIEFGSYYEKLKKSSLIYNWDRLDGDMKQKLDGLIESILCGKYIHEKDKEFILHMDGRKIEANNLSSGQQEMLPLAIILSSISYSTFLWKFANIYIEEPEAHLFPESQKKVVELIATIFGLSKNINQFFITTHSPYILTVFNNLMHAGALAESIAGAKKKQLFAIVPKEQILQPEEVTAYALQDGKAFNVIDKKTGLISAEYMDEVSNKIALQFGQLLDLE